MGSVIQVGLLVAACHAVALVLLLGLPGPRALVTLGYWLAPIVVVYLLGLRSSGVLAARATQEDPRAHRLVAGCAAAAFLLAAAAILTRLRETLPLTVVILGGVLVAGTLVFTRVRSARPNLLLACGSALLALGAAEAFLALVHDPLDPKRFVPNTPYAKYRELLIADDRLGFRLRPNSHVVFRREDLDYYRMDVRINSIGIRDVDYREEKPAGGRRIVFVGDSIVFGAGIELQDTIPKLLEASLNTTGDLPVYEVMNWGVGSYSLSQELGLLRAVGAARFQPDLLLVGTGPNDFGQSLKPNTYSNQTGLLATESDQSRFAGTQRGLLSLRSDRLLRFWLQRLLPAQHGPRSIEELSQTEQARSTRSDLAAFRDYANAADVRIAFVLFPSENLAGSASAGPEALAYELMRRQIAELGVTYLDCLPAVRAGTLRFGRLYVRWDAIHFNPRGTAVIAEAVARFVREMQPRIPARPSGGLR